MSRIGKTPIIIPKGVEIKIDNNFIIIKGPEGSLSFIFKDVVFLCKESNKENDFIIIKRKNENKNTRAIHGMTRAIINNMIIGVTKGFMKELDMIGVGYKANIEKNQLIINAGYSHPIKMDIDKDIKVEIPKPTKIIIKGIDKQKVGLFSSNIRKIRPPEPYKGKGIKYSDEYIKRKVGKTGSK